MLFALTNGDVIILAAALAMPLAALSYLGAAVAYREIGRGVFAMDHDHDEPKVRSPQGTAAERDAEIRQMLEAKAYLDRRAGRTPKDVESEARRLRDSY